jgi:hypothetical protein
LVPLRNLINNKLQLVHTSRLRVFEHPAEFTEKAASLAAAYMNEFYVERILEHRRKESNPKTWEYRVRWLGYEEADQRPPSVG